MRILASRGKPTCPPPKPDKTHAPPLGAGATLAPANKTQPAEQKQRQVTPRHQGEHCLPHLLPSCARSTAPTRHPTLLLAGGTPSHVRPSPADLHLLSVLVEVPATLPYVCPSKRRAPEQAISRGFQHEQSPALALSHPREDPPPKAHVPAHCALTELSLFPHPTETPP